MRKNGSTVSHQICSESVERSPLANIRDVPLTQWLSYVERPAGCLSICIRAEARSRFDCPTGLGKNFGSVIKGLTCEKNPDRRTRGGSIAIAG